MFELSIWTGLISSLKTTFAMSYSRLLWSIWRNYHLYQPALECVFGDIDKCWPCYKTVQNSKKKALFPVPSGFCLEKPKNVLSVTAWKDQKKKHLHKILAALLTLFCFSLAFCIMHYTFLINQGFSEDPLREF